MNKMRLAVCVVGMMMALMLPVLAQSGGTFTITKSVVAGGGGRMTGGIFVFDGTIGQPVAGTTSIGVGFLLESGFWAVPALAPTAAPASISGRVTDAYGRGIRGVAVVALSSDGESMMAVTNTFGRYKISGLLAGETYVLSAKSHRYRFENPTRIVSLSEDLTDENFIVAAPSKIGSAASHRSRAMSPM